MLRRLKKKMEKSGFSDFTYVIVAVYLTNFWSVIVSRNTRRPLYVFIGAAFESSEPLHGRAGASVGAMPTLTL